MAQLRMLLLTAVLAGLIWFAADQLDSSEFTVEAEIRPVVPASAPLAVRIEEPAGGLVKLEIRGRNAALNSLRGEMAGNRLPIRWMAEETLSPGEHQLDVLHLVAGDKLLLPFSVLSAKPARLRAVVDRYVTQDVPIQVNPGLFRLAGEARIEPAAATVRMLESHWRNLGDRSLELAIEKLLQGQPEGRLLTFEVPLPAQLAGQPASIQPKSAHVSVTLSERNVRRTLAPVVIKFAMSVDMSARFGLELRDAGAGTTDIQVIGPAERVATLEPQDILGVIEVNSEDAAATDKFLLRTPHFLLPEGVRLGGEPEPVEFRLIPVAP